MSNEANATASASGGVGFAGLLTIAFIVLKLTHVINWSWVWVLSPLWISFLLFVVVVSVVALIAFALWRRDEAARKALRNRRLNR